MRRSIIIIILIAISIVGLFLMANMALPTTALSTTALSTTVQPAMVQTSVYQEDIKIPVLMFHNIEANISSYFDSTEVTPEEFEETLKAIKDYGYTTISLDQLNEIYNKGKSTIKKPIVITFDDGYLSNYEYAFPMLKRSKMKANIFIVTSNVGKEPGIFPHFTWEQAKEMEDSGLIEIHNHTSLHKTADDLSDEEFLKSVREAQIDIEKNLGKRKVKAFAYPEGKYNENLISELKDEGFKLQFTVDKGQNSLKDKPEKLKRINVSHFEGGKEVIYLLGKHK